MTFPAGMMPQGGPPASNQGYRQLGGGYEQAIQQNQQPQQQFQNPMQQQQPAQGQNGLPPQMQQPQTQLGQPAQVAPSFQQAPPDRGWTPPPPLQQQQPQGQPQQQFQQQQQQPSPQLPSPQQQPQGVDLNQRVVGQNIPPELQGRTVGEVIAIANGLRQVHLQSIAQPQQQPVPQQQPAPQQQPQAGQQQQPQAWDWRNPMPQIQDAASRAVREVFQQEISPMLAPVVQNNHIQQAQNARNTVAQQIGVQRFAQLEPLIYQKLQGIDPRALLDPRTWEVAAHAAAGQLALAPQNQQPQTLPPQNQPGMYPANGQQYIQQPIPNLNGFYSEAPNQGGPGPQPQQLTAQELWAANAMGQSPADYMAWKGGGR